MADIQDNAFVVRFGEVIRASDLALSSFKHSLAHGGEFVISVNTLPDCTPDEVAARGRRPNRHYCYTTAAEIRSAGFTFTAQVDEDGHTGIVLPCPPSSDDLARLASCFTGRGENPNPVSPDRR